MDWNGILSAAAVVVAMVSAGGLGLQRSRVAALRQDVVDEKGRSEALRQDVADLKVADAEKDARIAQLESDLRHAEQMATRETQWVAMDEHLDHHHREAMTRLDKIIKAIEGKP